MEGNQEQLIRERAYSIWEREGRPEGRAVAHWFEAMRQLQAEGRIPKPATTMERDGGRHTMPRNSGGPGWGRRYWCRLSRRAA